MHSPALLLALVSGCAGPDRRHPVSVAAPSVAPASAPAVTAPFALGAWHEHRGTSADPGPLRAAAVRWRFDVGRPVLEALASDGRTAWVPLEGDLLAFTSSGTLQWRAEVRADGTVVGTPAGPVVPSSDGVVARLDPASGETVRAWPAGGTVPGPVTALGGELAWATRDGAVMGATGWRVETGLRSAGGVASDGETLFLGGLGGELVGVRADGEAWRAILPGPVVGHPVVSGDRVLVAYGATAGNSGGVSMRHADTGTEIWRWAIGFEPAAPPAWGSAVFVADMGGVLRALDPVDGLELWSTSGRSAHSVTPIATAHSVYAVEITGRVARLDPDDGGEIWVVDLESAATGTPVVVGDTLVVGLANGTLVGLGSPGEP